MAAFRAKHGIRVGGLLAVLALAGCAAYGPAGYDVYGGYGAPYASGYYGEPYAAPYAGGYDEPFGLGVFGFGVGGWGGHDHDWDHRDWDHHDWDRGHAWNDWQHHGAFGERNGFARAGGVARPGSTFGSAHPAPRAPGPHLAAAIPHAGPTGHRI